MLPPTLPLSPGLTASEEWDEYWRLHQYVLFQDHLSRLLWSQLVPVGAALMPQQHQPPYKMRKRESAAAAEKAAPPAQFSSSMMPSSNQGLISFRPHALMEEEERRRRRQRETKVGRVASDVAGRKRSYADSGSARVIRTARSQAYAYPKLCKYAPNNRERAAEAKSVNNSTTEEDNTNNINGHLNMYCLMAVFDFLDIRSKGRASQVITICLIFDEGKCNII